MPISLPHGICARILEELTILRLSKSPVFYLFMLSPSIYLTIITVLLPTLHISLFWFLLFPSITFLVLGYLVKINEVVLSLEHFQNIGKLMYHTFHIYVRELGRTTLHDIVHEFSKNLEKRCHLYLPSRIIKQILEKKNLCRQFRRLLCLRNVAVYLVNDVTPPSFRACLLLYPEGSKIAVAYFHGLAGKILYGDQARMLIEMIRQVAESAVPLKILEESCDLDSFLLRYYLLV